MYLDFSKASKIKENPKKYMELEELELLKQEDGIRRFKRKLFGFFGRKKLKSLDEIAQAFYGTGITSSFEEGKELTHSLVGKATGYYAKEGSFYMGFLLIKELKNFQGDVKYMLNIKKIGR